MAVRILMSDYSMKGLEKFVKFYMNVLILPYANYEYLKDDDNFYKLIRVDERDAVFQMCQRVAIRALSGNLPDITKGATHYHSKKVSPAWARKLTPVFEYKNHLFYKEVY